MKLDEICTIYTLLKFVPDHLFPLNANIKLLFMHTSVRDTLALEKGNGFIWLFLQQELDRDQLCMVCDNLWFTLYIIIIITCISISHYSKI